MLYAKFQDHRTPGSGEEDFLKVFIIYGRGDHLLYKLSFPRSQGCSMRSLTMNGQVVS